MTAILEMRGITKTFPGVNALDNVNLTVEQGEIHALVGENGAGKSTLMKVLSGVYPSGEYEGQIVFEGEERHFHGIADSEHAGIVIIHQELALVPLLSIAENIFLGNERAERGIVDWSETYRRTEELLQRVGLKESPRTKVTHLGLGKQQLVEIAKALSKEVKLLILDEPTSSLNENDSQALLELLVDLKHKGVSSILISHKLNEISQVADRITVLRDGATVSTMDCHAREISEGDIVRDMVGRSLSDRFPKRDHEVGETLLEVRNWTAHHPIHTDRKIVDDVSFEVKAGEVVGIAGLMGAGRTELAMSLFGKSYGDRISGEVYLRGQKVDVSTVEKAIASGICYATEDRKQYGLVLDQTIRRNIPLANLKGVANGVVVDDHKERIVAEEYRKALAIKCSGIGQKTVNLSGGNQQKVVLSKWLYAEPDILILDEPTRGIDVGAKYEIYTIINDLARQGKGIIVISSEMPELLGTCDRIYVMNKGQFLGQLPIAEASQEKIMSMILQKGGMAA
ncbi:multiple monosaccharide ABC transporter ATP-binding protein [Pelagibacterium xiamenense]|uniref:multiple monosaccharide ABC transporter ATP-binding protein n=1 Tax=Pelagibacterium xiamenense TaxID=2901140 RepID=UPI001E54CBF6|nr:multiple monosaccharide ABC transporter ATP-binding protein [Pelagibacterium xiamenense]MCD7058947.1 ATP-binding cassette domain-containing protein [Pelagibacterium xiamenense]